MEKAYINRELGLCAVPNSIKEAIEELEEAMKPKTCLDCKHYSQSTFYGDLKVVKYCHENRLGIGDGADSKILVESDYGQELLERAGVKFN